MELGYRETFWEVVCEWSHLWAILAAVEVMIGVLLAFSFLFVDPGTPAFVIAVLTALLLAVTLTLSLALVLRCRRWSESRSV
jgi:hypothetical protein